MAKRRTRRHRRGLAVKRRNNPGLSLSPTILIGILIAGGAAAYYFLSKKGSSSEPSGTDAYGNEVDSQGNVVGQPQLPSEQPTPSTPEVVIPANVTPVATPGGAPPKQVTLGPSTTKPIPSTNPALRPNFIGPMPVAEYERYMKLSAADRNVYYRQLTPAQMTEFWKTSAAVNKAAREAALASGTAGYEREAGAALMPLAIAAYYKTRENFDKNLAGYRGSVFYDLLKAVNTDRSKAPLLEQSNNSAEAKAYRLKLAKDTAASFAKDRSKFTRLISDFGKG